LEKRYEICTATAIATVIAIAIAIAIAMVPNSIADSR
jgi:hypothetical protein